MTKQNSKKRILITKPYLETGGVHSFVSNIISFFTLNVFVFKRGRNPKIKFKFLSLFHNFFTPFRYLFSIIFYQPNYIIVNTSLSKGNLIRDGIIIFISKIYQKKVLLIIHGFQENALKYKYLLKFGYFKADAIIVLAQEFADLIKKAGYKRKIVVQYNPVSIDIIDDLSNREVKPEEPLNNILFMSRVLKEKGTLTAIKAFKSAQKKYPKINMKIAGVGDFLKEAKKFVEENKIDNIEFLGFVKGQKKIELLKKSDVFLFPTEYKEGLPINILEAMAAKQVIITRPVGGLIDLFKDCSFGSLLYSVDPEDFKKAIVEINENKEKFNSIREFNSKYAINNFHPRIIVNHIEKVLKEL